MVANGVAHGLDLRRQRGERRPQLACIRMQRPPEISLSLPRAALTRAQIACLQRAPFLKQPIGLGEGHEPHALAVVLVRSDDEPGEESRVVIRHRRGERAVADGIRVEGGLERGQRWRERSGFQLSVTLRCPGNAALQPLAFEEATQWQPRGTEHETQQIQHQTG